jgi:hypothetical protein
MRLLELSEIYNLLSRGTEQVTARKHARLLRAAALGTTISGKGFNKVAFDTRFMDQETEFNPRRGAQNYQRSEAFITEAIAQKVKNFAKLRKVLLGLKEVYGKEHEWQDSNARVLLNTVDSGLRTIAQDENFSTNQPGTGSFDYIEELLNVRYRLNIDNLASMGETDLKRVIMAKDEELTRKDVKQALEITKADVSAQGYDSLMNKLFDGCRASAENPDIERTITITIRDRFHKES